MVGIVDIVVFVSGTGLMEIITEPDFRSADEAAAFVKELQLILLTIGTCDGKMEGFELSQLL